MAMISLLFLVLSLASVFFSSSIHILIGALFLAAVLLHNVKSRGFYAKCFSRDSTGRKTGDLVLIALIGFSCLLVLASGLLLAAGIMTLWFLTPWLWMHRIGVGLLVVLSLLHMRQEWL